MATFGSGNYQLPITSSRGIRSRWEPTLTNINNARQNYQDVSGRQPGAAGGFLTRRSDWAGAMPEGYGYDEVKGEYVPKYQSAGSKNALYDKLSNLALTGLNTMSSTSGGVGGVAGGGGGVPGLDVPQVTMPQSAAPDAATLGAQDLQFGAAKAKAGSMGRASLDALRANLAERGIMGGGTEARGLTDRLAAATNPLSDLNVSQAESNVATGNRRASEQFQGGIAQRGQDVGAAQQKRALDVQIAQQKSQQQQQYLQQVLSSLTKLLY